MQTGTEQVASKDYYSFERIISERVTAGARLFTTNTTGLWDWYIGNLPVHDRQHYNCIRCRQFIEKYGNIVTINNLGKAESLFWKADDVAAYFREAVAALDYAVSGCKISGVYFSNEEMWGVPRNTSKKTGMVWTHLHARNPNVYVNPLFTADQAMAQKKQEYIMLMKAIAKYPKDLVQKAVTVLKADVLARDEKTLAIAEWFLKIVGTKYNNNIWYQVAIAPPGWCHINNTMISTLLDDLAAGLDIEAVKRRWAEKMHPLQYRRPTAEVTDNQIDIAEKLVKTLGVERSLERRFARMEDVGVWLWKPAPVAIDNHSDSIFGRLKTKASGMVLDLGNKVMTATRFRHEILPEARKIEYLNPFQASYFGLVTAVHADAPNIMQWDNPVSYYLYVNGSPPRHWGLQSGVWTPVNGVFEHPAHWQDKPLSHFKSGLYFVLEGAKDNRAGGSGGGLFPENLRNDYHGIKKVIEKYSNTTPIVGEGNANGIRVGEEHCGNSQFKVTTAESVCIYTLDRWS